MAHANVEWVLRGIRSAHGITPTEKLVLVILGEIARAEHNGVCWPSVGTISAEACIQRRHASEILARLRKEGWVEIIGTNKGGRGKSTRYRLNLERLQGLATDQKHARERMVTGPTNNAVGRTVSGNESMQSGAGNHAISRRETMRSGAYEPLNYALISTGKPIEKSLNPEPENPSQGSDGRLPRQEVAAGIQKCKNALGNSRG